MKIRNGFISNSSSTSFTIDKNNLTKEQIILIQDHYLDCDDTDDEWFIYDENNEISGHTSSHRFNMKKYLKDVGVPDEYITWKQT